MFTLLLNIQFLGTFFLKTINIMLNGLTLVRFSSFNLSEKQYIGPRSGQRMCSQFTRKLSSTLECLGEDIGCLGQENWEGIGPSRGIIRRVRCFTALFPPKTAIGLTLIVIQPVNRSLSGPGFCLLLLNARSALIHDLTVDEGTNLELSLKPRWHQRNIPILISGFAYPWGTKHLQRRMGH